MNYGLLDLPTPLLTAVDDGLAWLGLPAVVRILVYAAASAWLCMTLYRRLSRQSELAELAASSRELRRELSDYDGPFDGLMQRVRKLLGLSSRHLRLSFLPAMLGGLPLLLLLPWMSNHFGLEAPAAGSAVTITVESMETSGSAPQWSGPQATWNGETQAWQVKWPEPEQSIELSAEGQVLLRLPLESPASIVHRRVPAFNWLLGNPAGYLPDAAPMFALHLDLPARQLHGLGPDWLRGWLAVYLIPMVLFSLAFKWRWKLQ